LAEVDEVEHGDGVGGAVGDVGELMVVGGVVGEAMMPTAGERKQRAKDRGEYKAAAGREAGWRAEGHVSGVYEVVRAGAMRV
jgi:hypothetical protein